MTTAYDQALSSQRIAADPQSSVFVRANAGSGKTKVLVDRIARLLLDGFEPSAFLCITYTKAAAAEMQRRLFERLGQWCVTDDEKLTQSLTELRGAPPRDGELARARTLFARALETPGGLRIQTIHAFCERLLGRFPIEAGIAPGFEIADETKAGALLAQAWSTAAARAMDAALHFATRLDVERLDKFRAALVQRREDIAALEGAGPIDPVSLRRRHAAPEDRDAFIAEIVAATPWRSLKDVADAMGEHKTAADLRAAAAAHGDAARFEAWLDTFLTGDRTPRRRLFTKQHVKDHPWIEQVLLDDAERAAAACATLRAIDRAEDAIAAAALAHALVTAYEDAKGRAGVLDFEDLISASRRLLNESGASAWVLYKLDGGIEHLLIDEAQDTSPAQWQIIRALTDEFFAGEGRHGSKTRTLFVVGDRKQSIYSFQGADPAVFETVLEDVSRQVRGARQEFRPVDLSVSFRSTPEVLEAVDAVFAPGSAARRDVDGGVDRDWHHEANRRGIPGVVEIWPLELPGDKEEELPWQAPIDREPAHTPRRRLAKKLAETIKGWIGRRRLLARDRAVEAGDILILVRQRNGFFDAMIRALWNEGVPVAGADRLKLGENIAVLDLMALAQFAIMPEDDHALACILKSPLLARPLSEDELLHIAANRSPGTLWQRLAQEQGAPFMAAAALLRPLRAMAARARPFEFFSGVLAQARGRFLERLGSEANDAIDALLGRALDYEEENGTSLAGFVNWFEAEEIEIKRNMEPGSGQVRVMTVHGAKGLEAPIVILPDTTSLPDARKSDPLLMLDSGSDGHAKVPLWAVPKLEAGHSVMRLKEKQKAASLAEYRRLLYVAMTRAEDELYVCGHANREKLPEACWYETVRVALQARMTTLEDGAGWRLGAAPVPEPVSEKRQSTVESSLPEWIRRPVAASPAPEAGEPPERPGNEEAVARGILIHRILENLPDLPQAERQAYIAAAVRRGGGDAALARQIETLTADPLLAEVLSADGHSEATLIAETPDGGIERRRIDRMVVTPEAILVADYKTDRQPPDTPEDCKPDYLMQLAIYRDALRLTAPGKPLRFCIVWTEAPRLMPIPDQLLDRMAALRQPRP